MKQQHNKYGKLSDISNMRDLQMHKLRLQVSNDFLEERIGDNVKGIKRQLTPRNLLLSGISKIMERYEGDAQQDSADGSSGNVLVQIFKTLLKVLG